MLFYKKIQCRGYGSYRKRKYYDKNIEKCRNDNRTTCYTLKDLIGPNKQYVNFNNIEITIIINTTFKRITN